MATDPMAGLATPTPAASSVVPPELDGIAAPAGQPASPAPTPATPPELDGIAEPTQASAAPTTPPELAGIAEPVSGAKSDYIEGQLAQSKESLPEKAADLVGGVVQGVGDFATQTVPGVFAGAKDLATAPDLTPTQKVTAAGNTVLANLVGVPRMLQNAGTGAANMATGAYRSLTGNPETDDEMRAQYGKWYDTMQQQAAEREQWLRGGIAGASSALEGRTDTTLATPASALPAQEKLSPLLDVTNLAPFGAGAASRLGATLWKSGAEQIDRTMAQKVLAAAGTGLSATGDKLEQFREAIPHALANLGVDPAVAEKLAEPERLALVVGILGGGLEHGAAVLAGEALPSVLQQSGAIARAASDALSSGEGTSNFFERMSRTTTGVPQAIFKALDDTGAGNLLLGAGKLAGATVHGAVVNPFTPLQFLASNGDMNQFGQELGQNLGFSGLGATIAMPFADQSAAAIASRNLADRMTFIRRTAQYAGELGSTPEEQVAHYNDMAQRDPQAAQLVASFAASRPDVLVKLDPTAKASSAYYDTTLGKRVVTLNPLASRGVGAQIAGHEFTHLVTMLPQVAQRLYTHLLGDKNLKNPGMLGQYDDAGQFRPNPEFAKFIDNYTGSLAANGHDVPFGPEDATAHGTPYDQDAHMRYMANEFAAESMAPYLAGSNAKGETAFSYLYRRNDALSKLVGSTVERLGGPGIVEYLDRKYAQGRIAPRFGAAQAAKAYGSKMNGLVALGLEAARAKEAMPKADVTPEYVGAGEKSGTVYGLKELQAAPAVAARIFGASNDLVFDENGKLIGQRPAAAAAAMSRKQAKAVFDALSRQDESKLPDGAVRRRIETDAKGRTKETLQGRFLTDEQLNAIARSNAFNKYQIETFRKLNDAMRNPNGNAFDLLYQTASAKGGRYATLATSERTIVPFLLTVTKDNNITTTTLDLDQFHKNYHAAVDALQRRGGQIPIQPQDLHKALSDYLQNQDSGYTGQGLPADPNHPPATPPARKFSLLEKNFLNELFGISTKDNAGANPYSAHLVEEGQRRSQSAVKAFRLDRMNELTPTNMRMPFDYPRAKMNFSPDAGRRAAFSPGSVDNAPRPGDDEVRRTAESYRVTVPGLPAAHQGYAKVIPELSRQVADAYQAMRSNPADPAVRASYQAFVKETVDQWNHAQEAGYTFEPWTGKGQPYANSKEMAADVRDNKHLYYFPTEGGFGSAEATSDHPLLKKIGSDADRRTVLANDAFRAVHDLFGHAQNGSEFGPRGELNAFLDHRAMFSDAARPAMTAETMGQNSWVNYGAHLRRPDGTVPVKGEEGYVAPVDRPFAEQKAALLPKPVMDMIDRAYSPSEDDKKEKWIVRYTEGPNEGNVLGQFTSKKAADQYIDDDPYIDLDADPQAVQVHRPEGEEISKISAPQTPEFKKWFGDSKVVDSAGNPLAVFHGTGVKDQFTEFKKGDIGFHFGTPEQADSRLDIGRNQEEAPKNARERLIPAFLSLKNPFIVVDDFGSWQAYQSTFDRLHALGAITDAQMKKYRDGGSIYHGTGAHGYNSRGSKLLRQFLEENGYDGIKYLNLWEGTESEDGEELNPKYSYIAFRPEQIKSATGNKGTFDAANKDIRFSPSDDKDRSPGGEKEAKVPFEVATHQKGAYPDALEDAQARLRGSDDQDPIRSITHQFADTLAKELPGALGSKVRVASVRPAVGGWLNPETGKTETSPNIVVTLSSRNSKGAQAADEFMRAITIAAHQSQGNVFRLPAPGEKAPNGAVAIALPKGFSEERVAALMKDLGSIQDSGGNPLLGGFTLFPDGDHQTMVLGDQFYTPPEGSTFKRELADVSKELDKHLANYTIPKDARIYQPLHITTFDNPGGSKAAGDGSAPGDIQARLSGHLNEALRDVVPNYRSTRAYSPAGESGVVQGDDSEGDRGERRAAEAYDRLGKDGAVSPEHFFQSYLKDSGETPSSNDPDALLKWASETGRILKPSDIRALEPMKAKSTTVEHSVYLLPHADAVIKVVRPGKWGVAGSDLNYFKNLRDMNLLTGGKLNIEVLGVVPHGTWPSVVTRMKLVQGGHPSNEELVNFLEKEDFEPGGNRAQWDHMGSDVELYDAHRGNWIKTASGILVPIDLHLRGDLRPPNAPRFTGGYSPGGISEAVRSLNESQKGELEEAGQKSDDDFFGKMWPALIKKTGLDLKPSLRNLNRAAEIATKDVHEWLQNNPRYLDYYHTDWEHTKKLLQEEYPELTDDQFTAYRMLAGVMSPNTSLAGSLMDATNMFHLWHEGQTYRDMKLEISAKGNRKSGSGPFKLNGPTAPTKLFAAHILEDLHNELGSWEKVKDYMTEGINTAQLQAFNKKVGFQGPVGNMGNIRRVVEQATGQGKLIPRMFIFGPKVGAYTLNCIGDDRFTTTDIWEGRFIRSHFPDMFKSGTGLPVNVDEHEIFQKFATRFGELLEKKTGLKLSPSALQAARWFFMIEKASQAGYRYANTSGTISDNAAKALEGVHARFDKRGRRGSPEADEPF